jgi:hypothetical protein
MPFIQTCYSSKRKCKPEGYHAVCVQYVPFSRGLSAKQMAKSKQCKVPTKEARGLTTPRSSKPPSPVSTDVIIAAENECSECSERCALRLHSCKALCPFCSTVIATEIEVHQRCALGQHACIIAAEIKVRQRWALRQHSCKPLCILSYHTPAARVW